MMALLVFCALSGKASSHREAPLISNDPLADNTDLYAFRSPDNPNKITIIACYIPMQFPQGGPNYYHFGENVRYEIHIDNNILTPGDDIIYRFTFKSTNEDPTTFFDIRLGLENQKTTYKVERSIDGGATFQVIKYSGDVPPPYIGPRSISDPVVGLGVADYRTLIEKGITTANTGEKIYCGPADDPFYVDLGGIFDVGDAPRIGPNDPSYDGLACKNVSAIAIQVDISALQKDHKTVNMAADILDPDFVIGVWASATRQSKRVLNGDGTESYSGKWVQVSRLGMPLLNEVVNPIGAKDYWNYLTPYEDLPNLSYFGNYFYNPELSLYMDTTQFGSVIPSFDRLRIQRNSLGMYGFGNGQDGLYPLKGTAAVEGTALDDSLFGTLLLPAPGSPRSVDIYPIFQTGVPNLSPYQLAINKNDNPLAPGKPFVNNFLPNGGDMLRLNMAVPVTPRNDPNFNKLGLLQAAVLGLTDPAYNTTNDLQFIPNMDGFPNGRRLEDDVTRIELQAVGGIVLAVIGLPYDDYVLGGSLVTPQLSRTLAYRTGISKNDTNYREHFPYVQTPWIGTAGCCGVPAPDGGKSHNIIANHTQPMNNLNLAAPQIVAKASPNPFVSTTTISYHLEVASNVTIAVYYQDGKTAKVLVNQKQQAGNYTVNWNAGNMAKGIYTVTTIVDGKPTQSIRLLKQ